MKKALIAAGFALTLALPLAAAAQEGPSACQSNSDCPVGSTCGTGGLCEAVAGFPTAQTTVNGAPQATTPGSIDVAYLMTYSQSVQNIINFIIVPVVIAIAFLMFVWGAYKYFILGADDATARKTGRDFLLWSIIGFVVIFSIWGLVALVGGTLGLRAGVGAPPTPKI